MTSPLYEASSATWQGTIREAVPKLWNALVKQGLRLAEERSYLDRNGLIRLLDAQGIVLRPLARLRTDIGRLEALSAANIQLIGDAVSISTPDGPVRVVRSVEPTLLSATENLAVTGAPGSGKTVLLHRLATAAQPTHDLVVLRSDDLRSGAAATRAELSLTYDLCEVLAGWTGKRPGLGVDRRHRPGPRARHASLAPTAGVGLVRDALADRGNNPFLRSQVQQPLAEDVPRHPGWPRRR